MNYVQVVNGAVANRIVFDGAMPEDWPDFQSWVQTEDAQIGWSYSGNVFTAPEPAPPEFPIPPPPLAPISDRQFAQALKNASVITFQEAMAFVQVGTIPALLQGAIDAIADQSTREAAELLVAGATQFYRNHPMTIALGSALNWSPEQMDALWVAAAAL